MEAEIGRKEVDREVFGHGLQDGYLSFNPHVKGGPFPLRDRALAKAHFSNEGNEFL